MSSDRVATAAGLGPGALVLVVGPSGAGKDTLIARARELLGEDRRIVFPARIVTRPPHDAEEHLPATPEDFAIGEDCDAYALSWEAHGLFYALPKQVNDAVKQGSVVVVNVSRAIVPVARMRYARTIVVYIDAPPELRQARLAARGRESGHEIAGRLSRTVQAFGRDAADAVIDNDGTVDEGAGRLAAIIRTQA